MVSSAPKITPDPPVWQKLLAKLMQLALYGRIIGMLAGWLLLSAAGKPIPFFGLELPALIGANKDLSGIIKEVHEIGGTLGYCLIAFHAAAALYHHYVVGGNTLQRMIPARRGHLGP